MTREEMVFEAAKLLAQLGGATVVAWLGVRWALGRYKSEKTWERRFAAFADILATLSEIQRVLDEWQEAEAIDRMLPGEKGRTLRADYDLALKSIAIAQGQAGIILPEEVGAILRRVPTDLSNAEYKAKTPFESYDARWGVVRDAMDRIKVIAKQELGLPPART